MQLPPKVKFLVNIMGEKRETLINIFKPPQSCKKPGAQLIAILQGE